MGKRRTHFMIHGNRNGGCYLEPPLPGAPSRFLSPPPHLVTGWSLHRVPRHLECKLLPQLPRPSVMSSVAGCWSRHPNKRAPPGRFHCGLGTLDMMSTLGHNETACACYTHSFTAYKVNRYPAPTSTMQGCSQSEVTQPNSSLVLRPCPVTVWAEEIRISRLFICVSAHLSGSSAEPSPPCSP